MNDNHEQEPLLQVKNLKTHFNTDEGTVKSVDGVSFDMESGQTLAIVGESGCGKSMTAFSITGLVPPGGEIKGDIIFDGKNITNLSEKEMRHIDRKSTRLNSSHVAI